MSVKRRFQSYWVNSWDLRQVTDDSAGSRPLIDQLVANMVAP